MGKKKISLRSARFMPSERARVNPNSLQIAAAAFHGASSIGPYFPSAFRNSVLAESTSRGAAWQSKSARNLSPW
jgi:hypothetical protein